METVAPAPAPVFRSLPYQDAVAGLRRQRKAQPSKVAHNRKPIISDTGTLNRRRRRRAATAHIRSMLTTRPYVRVDVPVNAPVGRFSQGRRV